MLNFDKNTFENCSKGCWLCGEMPIKLPMNYKIVQGFGGSYIEKNGKVFYWPNDWNGSKKEWNKQKTLMIFELKARKDRADWRLINNQPLHNEVYQRQGKNNWVLVEKGMGFA